MTTQSTNSDIYFSTVRELRTKFDKREISSVEATRAMLLGCVGKWAIHPAQVEIAQRVFSPKQEEVDRARKSVQAYDAAVARGEGAAQFDDAMIDAASVRMVQNTLDKADLYGL